MITQDVINLLNQAAENISVGVRLPEGMDPRSEGLRKWQLGVQAGQRSMREFYGYVLDGHADAMVEAGEAVDYSAMRAVVEVRPIDLARVRLRTANTGDPEVDFETVSMGETGPCQNTMEVINRHIAYVLESV